MSENYVVLLLVGGDSPERDVSLESGKSICEALKVTGHQVFVADPGRPDIPPAEEPEVFFRDARITSEPPVIERELYASRAAFIEHLCGLRDLGFDVVFNALHGGVGENGTLQACLDYLGIPYTGSGALACALSMDKNLAKQLAAGAGVPTAESFLVDAQAVSKGDLERTIQEKLAFPVVIKPNHQGSSVGVSIVRDPEELSEAISKAAALDRALLVERYIKGREITAAVLGDEALPLVEIQTREGFYDYRNKYTAGANEYLVPAPLRDEATKAIQVSALQAYRALGCSAYGRVDLRYSEEGRHYFLEVNTLPGMTASSLVPKAAKAAGIDFPELIDRILRLSMREE